MEELPIQLKETIIKFKQKVYDLEQILNPFLENEKKIVNKLENVDVAKLNLAISYSIITLFDCMFRIN